MRRKKPHISVFLLTRAYEQRMIKEDKVVITAFSGENRLSSREVTVDDYYDEEHPEFDDCDYIRDHRIDCVEIVMDAYDDHKEYKNYYDEQGRLYRSESNENGELFTDIMNYDEIGLLSEEHICYDVNGTPHSEKKIYRK